MADDIKATPPKNKGALEVAKAIQKAHEFIAKPFGYQNPPGEMLSELVGLPAVAQTLERIGYGEPLTIGAGGLGGTSRPRPETIEAGLAVAPLSGTAAKAAGKTAKFAGKGAAKLIERGMFGEGPLAPITPQVLGVIKQPNGNWLTGSVEQAVKPLKGAINTAEGREELRQLREQVGDLPRYRRAEQEYKNQDALDNWIDRNLTNYIKKEMATPEDPVRLLIERRQAEVEGKYIKDQERAQKMADRAAGETDPRRKANLSRQAQQMRDEADLEREFGMAHLSHLPSGFGETFSLPSYIGFTRESRGFPVEGMSKTQASKIWEDLSDSEISGTKAKLLSDARKNLNPWTEKLNPEELVYGISRGQERELGFDHIVDVLKQDLAAGRITPEQLNKVSMEQAVRRTAEFDQDMAKKMREARIKVTEGMPVYKEYPEGYKWIELAVPNKLPEKFSVAEQNGRFNIVDATTGDPLLLGRGQTLTSFKTPEEAVSAYYKQNPKVLEEALKYEGETMGHCVGGYCPDVIEGRSRIFSLRDAKGEPHVTVEVEGTTSPYFRATKRSELANKGMSDEEIEAALQNMPPRINQIKGKQNRAPKEEYLPFVQDFVREGQWSGVGDFQNTGLVRKSDLIDKFTPEQLDAIGKGEYLTKGEYDDLLLNALRPEGMKRGGVVMSDNPDTMMLELQDKKMQVGGFVKGGKEGAKKILSFFSKADEAAKELPRTKGTGAEFMKELEKAKGVKPAEIQHRKLDEIKAMPKMTKEEFLGELEKRPPANLTEKVLKQPSEAEIEKMAEKLADTEAKQYAKRHAESWKEEDYLFREEKERLLESDIDRLRDDARFELTSGVENKGSAPKFGTPDLTLPGGKDYREILLKLPPETATPEDLAKLDFINQRIQELRPVVDNQPLGITPERKEYSGLWDEKEKIQRLINQGGGYKSSHWNEPNVIAHARVSDRIGPNGEKVLHVEEIQSDWHQAGRRAREKEVKRLMEEKGISKKEASALVPENFGYGPRIEKTVEAYYETKDGQRIPVGFGKTKEEADASIDIGWKNLVDIKYETLERKVGEGVPDAPFKKNWQELMMNRILADAAEKGYDRVVITPGAIQAERYDLSKQVSSLMFYTDPKSETGILRALDLNGEPVIYERIPVSKLDDYVGKDAAKKLLDQTPIQTETTGIPSELRTLNGVDLQVGGEGMKGFYDKILPDYLNSLGKKYGVEVEQFGIKDPNAPTQSRWAIVRDADNNYRLQDTHSDRFALPEIYSSSQDAERAIDEKLNRSLKLHSFKITPEMRQEFTEKGFPMYSVAAPVGLGATQIEEPKPVQMTDNPDAMMLEVEDQKFGKGGAAKGIIEGIAQRLTRSPAKSKQEIEAIAERIAPQVTGEFVRGEKGTQSVAGKTQKQFAREKDLPVEFTDVKPVPKVEVVDPETLKGMVVTGIPGDPTVTGKSLVRVGDIKLDSPSPQHGGPLYGLGRDDDIFWASGIGPASGVQRVAREASQAYDAPVVGQYIMMGPESINYAMHFADANLSAIDLSKMTKKQIEEFNKLIRFGDEKSGPRPSFPGIENKEDAYLHFAFDPHLRKYFNKLMQMPTVTETFGLPSGQDIRFAITEAPLRDLETGVTGYSMGRLAPDVPKSALPLSEHPTYSHDIPGQFIGGLKYPTPYELSFPDTLKAVRENPKQSGQEFGSLKMVGPRQIYDQQMIDELKMYEDYMKRLTGKKEGGEVNKPMLEKAKESLSDAFSAAMNKVSPMRYMGRLAVLDAAKKSPMMEGYSNPELAKAREKSLKQFESNVEEFKRHNRNQLKRALGLQEEPIPEVNWDKFLQTIPIDEIESKPTTRKIDGFAGGGATSKAAMEAFAKLKAMRGEFAGKAAEQARYAKETAHIPAKELPSFEEWKATQINVTPENIQQLKSETGNKGGGLIKVKNKRKAKA